MLDANFWQNKIESKNIVKEKKLYEDLIDSLNETNQKLKDLDELNLLAIEENNLDIQKETLENLKELKSSVKKNEIKCFLSTTFLSL